MKLHEKIYNFYINHLKPLFKIEVLSDNNKWSKINSLNITDKQFFYQIRTKNNVLLCTKNHILIDSNGDEILAIDSKDKVIKTINGNEKVLNVIKTSIFDNAYDLSLDDESDHLYFANNFLSHNCIICDEFAFLQKNIADKLFTSMYPTISSSKNGKFIIVSTPNGTGNLYYDIWQQANAKDKSKNLDGWKPFEMYWWQVPGHDEEWKKKQIAAIGEQRFAQEFNNEFISSSSTKKLVPEEVIERYRMRLTEYKNNGIIQKKQKIVSQDEKEIFEFDMWHEFSPKNTYVASMDISEGVGKDSSVLYIWDVTDLSKITMCAKFSSSTVSLVQFAYVSRKILALYNDPFLAAERNGVSAGTLDSLRITYGYQNIIIDNKQNEPGIYSHITVKQKACIWARQMMTTIGFDFIIYDKDIIDEFGIFCKKETKGVHLVYQALPGPNSHDDHVMAFIWMTYALNKDLINNYFCVCQEFTDQFENVYPKLLQPLTEYTSDDWIKIKNDPLYKDFLDFKEEMKNKLKNSMKAEDQENDQDIFKYVKSQSNDPYFDDDGSDSWNNYSRQSSFNTVSNNRGPAFFI